MKTLISFIVIATVVSTGTTFSQNTNTSVLKGVWYISDTLNFQNTNKLHLVKNFDSGNTQQWDFHNDSILFISHVLKTPNSYERKLNNTNIIQSRENFSWNYDHSMKNKNMLTINAWSNNYTFNIEKISNSEILLSTNQIHLFPLNDNKAKQFYFTHAFKDSTFLFQRQLTLAKNKIDVKYPYIILHPDSSFNIAYNIKFAENQGNRGWIAYKKTKQINGIWTIDSIHNELTLILKNNNTLKYQIEQNDQYLNLKKHID